MGNCLVLEERKVIKIMRVDGEIITYDHSHMKVQQVLDDFPRHDVSDESPAMRCLDSTASMRHEKLYYLLPQKKTLVAAETGEGAGLIRVKLVLTKQELKNMLSKGSEVSHGDMLCLLQRAQSKSGGSHKEAKFKEWRPFLETIPEGNDF
ncbi:hypothetical protein Cni_G09557 [Canna indica]|uniref:Uncharacterized protein n=1 Tax=Canna indica TaxID=4628 RepID=A0AAQ3K484_9LILI|nr:hypothetical protein Cni_G09557 [Canna indica]